MIHFSQDLPFSVYDFAPVNPAVSSTRRLILQGDVVTMNAGRDILRDGAVCIEDSRIVAVQPAGAPVPPAFEAARRIDTQGTLFPGLIDLHNHLHYNALPLWKVPAPAFENRNAWRRDHRYINAVKRPFRALAEGPDADYRRAIVRFAECRSLLGGTTTGQGMALKSSGGWLRYFQGLTRNVERPTDEGWPAASGQGLDYTRDQIATELIPALAKPRPFFYHLSEGTDAQARQRFLDLKVGEDQWAINGHLVCIHGVALTGPDFDMLKAAAGLVWSPTSNLLLYGQTTAIDQARRAGVPLALGVDWAPSGRKNLLGELKTARAVCRAGGIDMTAADLVAMVTCTPARMIGWDRWIGTLAPERRADILVMQGRHADPCAALVDAQESDILAVLIDGRVRLGRADGLTLGSPGSSERIQVGGRPYHLDLTEVQVDGLGGMTLAAAVDKLREGLAHLQELEGGLHPASGDGAPAAPFSVLELGESWRFFDPDEQATDAGPDRAALLTTAASESLAVPLPAATLEALTEADDPAFRARLKAAGHIPAEVRELL